MFFQSIHQMIAAGTDLSINIRQVNNRLSVAVMPRRTNLKDEAQQLMVPLVLSGTPEELDAGFLQAIAAPVQKAQGILTNLEAFEKQAEQAASQSKTAKSVAEKESKEAREKREKMEKLLKKADEAVAANRYSEAMTWLKQAKVLALPDKQKEIEAQITEVQKKASEGSLFSGEAAPQPAAVPQPQQGQTSQPQQPVQPQQMVNGNPVQNHPGAQMQMFTEQPVPQPVPMQQPIQAPQPAPEQPQWHQPIAMPQTAYFQGQQPQAYNPQGQQPINNIPNGQYGGQPQMYTQQQANGWQWQQPVPQQSQQPVTMQMTPVNGGGREYHSQPQSTEPFNFDKDDESDRELLQKDPYAEYPDFPMECRIKDEAQVELVYC